MALTDAEAPYDIVHIGHLGESQYISEKINQSPESIAAGSRAGRRRRCSPACYGPPLQHFMEAGCGSRPTT